MKLIVGLGNPDPEYEATWHNLGFRVIDALAERLGVRRFRSESEAQVAGAVLASEKVLLAKPQTYMNLSGNAVRPLVDRYGSGEPGDLIVVCDDIALPLGMIRVRGQGSAGGQKGLKSVIERLGTQQFGRVRLGIKPDHPVRDLAEFVLSRIPRKHNAAVAGMIDTAVNAVEIMAVKGIGEAMQAFNRRVKLEGEADPQASLD
jgi:PTH1 family peptidyl-tRNA hydrolase